MCLPYVRVGRHIRYRAADVAAFIERGTVMPPSPRLPFHAVGGGDEAVELDVRVDLVRRADPAVAHDGGAGHVVQSEPVQDGRGGVAGGVGHVLVAQADAVQGRYQRLRSTQPVRGSPRSSWNTSPSPFTPWRSM